MQRRTRIAFPIIVLVLVLLGLSFPVSNLIIGAPSVTLKGLETEDAAFKEASAILAAKCVNCHTEEYTLPFYARFPLARGVIEKDILEGLWYVNYQKELVKPSGEPVGEVILAKTEQVIAQGSMPPGRYIALHWDGRLSAGEKQALMNWIHGVRAAHYATGLAADEFKNEIVQPLPLNVEVDAQKAALGNKLFHDPRLSKDDTLSCAGCHDLKKGGTDQARTSTGVGDAIGPINAPTVYNAGFQFLQFWDGRAADLQEQADGPVNNPIEMASNWEEAIPKLQQDEALTAEFLAVYPHGYSKDTITEAIAIFEETLITPNAAFDKYLMGDADAINDDARQGYAHFKEFNCATCHAGKILGGQSFEKMGLKADYFAERGTEVIPEDLGRFNVTKDENDRHKLKTPTLRNITVTYPYFHDGSTSDLGEAVETMSKYQVGRTLSAKQIEQIVAFLETLTGEYNGELLQ